jgi:hypothetical protein
MGECVLNFVILVVVLGVALAIANAVLIAMGALGRFMINAIQRLWASWRTNWRTNWSGLWSDEVNKQSEQYLADVQRITTRRRRR